METKYSLQGFYRKNWRNNTRKEEATLRLLVGRIEAEELTVVSPGRGGAAGLASSPATACGGAVARCLLWARAACGERRTSERGKVWHCEGERDRVGAYL